MIANDQVQIIVPADLRFSNSVRNFISDLLLVINVSEIWVNRLILVIDELFMNAVKYGSKDRSSSVYVTIGFNDQEIVFTIEDMGTGQEKVDPEKLEKIILSSKEDTSLSKTSGRGLSMIVSNWTDGFKIEKSEHGGIKVITRKNLSNIIAKQEEVRQISIGDMPEVAVIKFAKQVDVHDSEMAKEMLRSVEESPQTLYMFDLQELDYINSVFIGLLAKLYNAITKKQGKVVIITLSGTIQDTLKLVGLTDIIPIVATMEDAKKALLAA